MSNGTYIGVDGKARKVTGIYVGVDGVARKVAKGYIGDSNGKARLFYVSSIPIVVYVCHTESNLVFRKDANSNSSTIGTVSAGQYFYKITDTVVNGFCPIVWNGAFGWVTSAHVKEGESVSCFDDSWLTITDAYKTIYSDSGRTTEIKTVEPNKPIIILNGGALVDGSYHVQYGSTIGYISTGSIVQTVDLGALDLSSIV